MFSWEEDLINSIFANLFSFSIDKTNGLSKGYLRSIPSQNSMKYLMFIIFLKVLYFAIGSTFLDYLFLKIGEGNGSPLQYSFLENPMNRGAWGTTVHGVANSRTRLSDSHTHTHRFSLLLYLMICDLGGYYCNCFRAPEPCPYNDGELNKCMCSDCSTN